MAIEKTESIEKALARLHKEIDALGASIVDVAIAKDLTGKRKYGRLPPRIENAVWSEIRAFTALNVLKGEGVGDLSDASVFADDRLNAENIGDLMSWQEIEEHFRDGSHDFTSKQIGSTIRKMQREILGMVERLKAARAASNKTEKPPPPKG